MLQHRLIRLLASMLVSVPLIAAAQTAGSDGSQAQSVSPSKPTTQQLRRSTEPVYGSQLMTPQERTEYRNKMRAAKTAEERERLRVEHHDQMVTRAKERGVTLPEQPPARGHRGQGAGPGKGMGPRAGGGQGMGPGPGAGAGSGLGPGAGTAR